MKCSSGNVDDRKLVSYAITALPPVHVDFLMRKSPFFPFP
jgi:hypothetical protein